MPIIFFSAADSSLSNAMLLQLPFATDDESFWLWVSVALAAGIVVLLLGILRRVWKGRRLQHLPAEMSFASTSYPKVSDKLTPTPTQMANQLNRLQEHLRQMGTGQGTISDHWQAYSMCDTYLRGTQLIVDNPRTRAEVRVALRVSRERVQSLHRKHLMDWARIQSQTIMQEAVTRVRTSDKIETAQKAVDTIADALRVYPDSSELQSSAVAISDAIASMQIGYWVDLAERAVFQDKIDLAVERYQDALFYLSRTQISETLRHDTEQRLLSEIDILRSNYPEVS